MASFEMLRSHPAAAAGCALVVAVAGHTLVALVGSLRRQLHQRGQFRHDRERLNYLVLAARSQWRAAEAEKSSWNGWRKFRVGRKTQECEGVCSFILEPHDGRPLPGFKPGQYLTFGLDIPGRDKQVVRCYSLSEAPQAGNFYRVTIKREAKEGFPPGAASSYFCETALPGDILNVKAPAGHFFLELEKESPVVLIGAGVGVTPLLSMAKAVVASGIRREVWFFFVCRSSADYLLRADMEALAKSGHARVQVCFSRPEPADVKGRDYQHEGRLTPDLLKSLLPSINYDFYLCGNGPFMRDMYEGLTAWGVPETKIHFEAFGPATIKKTGDTMHLKRSDAMPAAPVASKVSFVKSNVSVPWDPKAGNLLEFARAHGVRIDSGCCAGSCGSCLVAIKSGSIEYLSHADAQPEAGSCLTCICRPTGDLVLDA